MIKNIFSYAEGYLRAIWFCRTHVMGRLAMVMIICIIILTMGWAGQCLANVGAGGNNGDRGAQQADKAMDIMAPTIKIIAQQDDKADHEAVAKMTTVMALVQFYGAVDSQGQGKATNQNTKAASNLLPKATFRVEVATTARQQEQGLMFRKNLPDDGGMLFPMAHPQVVHMWMKDTPLSLDMIFVDALGRVRGIISNASPESEMVLSSGVPIKWVLELKGGTANRWRITLGDKMLAKTIP